MNAIEIKGLEKRYPGFELKLDLNLPQGCILGLVGKNGAGKSTTIRSILGMTKADAGAISVLGQGSPKENAALKERIGYVPDEPAFPVCMTAGQIGKMMAGIYRNWDAAEYSRLLHLLEIPEGNTAFQGYSRGMKMKLSIAVALSHHAELLILDEPTSGLDPVVRDEVVELFSEFTRDETHSILISSHIVSDLEKLCDYIAFLDKGRLLLCEETDRLRDEYGLIQCTSAQLEKLDKSMIAGHRHTPYGETVIAKKALIPNGFDIQPVGIEDLFVLMVKEEEK